MKYLFFLFAFTISSFTFSQPAIDTVDCNRILKSPDFTIVKTVQEIAPWIFVKFPEWEKMSNPGKKFNTRDNCDNHKRRLFFAARSGDNWIVSYEHSGRDYHAHCIFITVNERNEICTFDYCTEVKAFENLKKQVLTDTIPCEIWDGYEY